MSPQKKSQSLKPLTAASKLGIYLPAAPEEFQNTPITREELDELNANPPQWLIDLRKSGPFPRDITAHKLRVSNSGLTRAEVSDALTADEIAALLADPPAWLVAEQANYVEVLKEAERVKARDEERRAATNRPAKNR